MKRFERVQSKKRRGSHLEGESAHDETNSEEQAVDEFYQHKRMKNVKIMPKTVSNMKNH